MSDNTLVTGVVAPTTETKGKKTRNAINQAHARELAKAEAVAVAAQKPERSAALTNREVDDEFISGLLAAAGDARSKSAEVVIKAAAQSLATKAQEDAEAALLAALREVQKAAKQKYQRSNPRALAAYFVGEELNGNKENLAQTSETILEQLAGDKLPGFTPAKVKAVGTARANWVTAAAAHVGAQSAATEARAEFKELLKSLADQRVTVQLAADAEWPHTAEENRGLRKEFALSATRPLVV